MLGSDMSMIQALCLFSGIRKNPPTLQRKRQVYGGRDLFTDGHSCFDFLTNALSGGRTFQETIGQVLVFSQQSEKQVLGFDRHAAELAGLITSEEDHSPRSFCVAFKHMRSFVRCILPNY